VRELERETQSISQQLETSRAEHAATSAQLATARSDASAIADKLAEAAQFVRQQSTHIAALSRALDEQARAIERLTADVEVRDKCGWRMLNTCIGGQDARQTHDLADTAVEVVPLLRADVAALQAHADRVRAQRLFVCLRT
jgi:predicted RNase H-like nuclease (RuvC/YqgF family)